MKKKRLALFGSTGSIGQSTLDVVRRMPDVFAVEALTAHENAGLLCDQIAEFHPAIVAIVDPAACEQVRSCAPAGTRVLQGDDGLLAIARDGDYDVMVSALVGFAGMLPTIEAIRSGRQVALANKETLVAGGSLITQLLARHGSFLTPIDSEHSAILQCLAGEHPSSIARLILTASGGPFRGRSRGELHAVTVADALRHPNWSMGRKITIDSATLMNKGLEVIEARWLFDLPASSIDVVIHPQSIIHSMVEFVDGSVKAQMGVPDMKLPILYALTWPDRLPFDTPRIDWPRSADLRFEEPDRSAFPCLQLAYDAIAADGTAPAMLNAANEAAVHAFLDGSIAFHDIPRIIGASLDTLPHGPADSVEAIVDADARARRKAGELIRTLHCSS